MKAAELRLGNWVDGFSDPDDRDQVEADWFNSVDDDGDISCRPIPLDEQWLLKAGFTHTKYIYCDENELNGGIGYSDEETIIRKGDRFFFIRDESADPYDGSTIYRYIEIKHVHQLQNLYFALTGEELTIKDTLG
jgi:hypothetical protein